MVDCKAHCLELSICEGLSMGPPALDYSEARWLLPAAAIRYSRLLCRVSTSARHLITCRFILQSPIKYHAP